MNFAGFQKLTLLDYPGKVACIVFTKGCNFRCPFCHNASLVENKGTSDISDDEVLDFLKKRKGILDGICISGGEPLINSSIAEFISPVKDMGYLVKLDTNGTNPQRLKELIDARLVDYVAMDIKSSPQNYSSVAGCDADMDSIYRSISIIIDSGIEHEFRTTFVKELHTIQDVDGICKMIDGAKKYYLQSFVDSGDVLCANLSAFGEDELKELEKRARIYIPAAQIRGI